MGSMFFELSLSNTFMGMSHQARETKSKMNKRDHIKLKLFLSKGNCQQNKRQPIEWEKIFVNNTSDTRLISKIYKKLILLNIKKKKKIKKWAEDLNRHFSKKTYRWSRDT